MGKKKPKTKPKKKNPVVRQPKGDSTVFAVINSDSAKQGAAKTPPAPAIKIKKVADFAFGSINDIPAHLASHVTWTGEGTVQYEPPLNEVGPARSYPYRVAVTVAGAPVAPTPAELTFRVLPLDPELTVGSLANFELGSINDIPATIAGLVHHKSTATEKEIVYEPELDTIGPADDYTIAIQVPAHGNYKQSKRLTLSFSIFKRTPSFTIKTIDDLAFQDNKNEQKMRNAVKVKAGGEPAFEPPLDSVQDPGSYAINVYLEETKEYAESGYQTLNVNILSTSHFKTTVFGEWEQANADVVNASQFPKKQLQQKKVEIQQDRTGAYEKRSAINDALNQVIGVPNRATVWTELGYTLRGSEWDMPEYWTTSLGTRFHLTISANSIIVPRSKAEWAAAAAALFDVLFLSPPVTERVHLTLEEATSKSPSSHLFMGGVTGANKAVADSWWRNQAGEMKPKLAQFKAQMVKNIGDIKAKYKL